MSASIAARLLSDDELLFGVAKARLIGALSEGAEPGYLP